MKIQRADFLAALQRVAPLCKGRTSQPILSHVLMEAMNGGLRITASDGASFVSAVCVCDGNLNACCVAPGPLLAIAGFGPDTMELTLKDRLEVKCGSISRLSVLPRDEFPAFPSDNLTEHGIIAGDLVDAIKAVSWASDPKSTKGISGQSVWVNFDTKKSLITALSMDGHRLGLFRRTAVVPNLTMLFPGEYANLICEALAGEDVSVKTNPSWIVVQGESLRCAINQWQEYKPPIDHINECFSKAKDMADLPLEETMKCLSTLRSVAGGEEFVYAKATLQKDGVAFEYSGKTSDFHSVVALSADSTAGTQSKSHQDKSKDTAQPNVAGVCLVDAQIQFNAALLHNVLRHTPGKSAKAKLYKTGVIFESGEVTTALALCQGEYK